MSNLLRQRMSATPAMLAIWDDDATIRHALAFEAALAEAQGGVGHIPEDVARRIGQVARTLAIDPAALADEAALAGTLAIPLVDRLRAALDAVAARHVHRGATSQDLADTVLACQLRDAARLLLIDADRIAQALAPLALRHAATPAMGRTLLQDALPIGLGLRFAQWHAGIAQAALQMGDAVWLGARLQLGGPVGTRAGMGAVAPHVADALGLPASLPWHSRRNGTVAVAASLGILIGAVGKMARDIALLAQNGIGELREPIVAGRGGSSAMAHKRNPTGCQTALAAVTRAPGLVATMLSAMSGEEERGLGNWQSEAPVLAELCCLASGALNAMAFVAEGLEIDETAIRRNVDAGGKSLDIGESAGLVDRLLSGED